MIIQCLRAVILLRDDVPQIVVITHYIIGNSRVAYGREVATGTFYLRAFRLTEKWRRAHSIFERSDSRSCDSSSEPFVSATK